MVNNGSNNKFSVFVEFKDLLAFKLHADRKVNVSDCFSYSGNIVSKS